MNINVLVIFFLLKTTTATYSQIYGIATGTSHRCVAFKPQGWLRCWGTGGSYQLGTGTNPSSITNPIPTLLSANITSVSLGSLYSCAQKVDSTVWCVGQNDVAQTGLLSPTSLSTWTRSPSLEPTSANSFVTGARHSCRIAGGDNHLECIGKNLFGELCRCVKLWSETSWGTASPSLIGVSQIAIGWENTLVVMQDNSYYACGRNENGQLGLGYFGSLTDSDATNPSCPQKGNLTNVAQISISDTSSNQDPHTLFLLTNGSVACAGGNSRYQCCQPGATPINSPIVITALSTTITQVQAGANYSMFLDSNHNVWFCGTNLQGESGIGTDSSVMNYSSPIQVPGLSNVLSIHGRASSPCVVFTNGILRCWGEYGLNSKNDNPLYNANQVYANVLSVTSSPTKSPTLRPSVSPRAYIPSHTPSQSPSHSAAPTRAPSRAPSRSPSRAPSRSPSRTPTRTPSRSPSRAPSHSPSRSPSRTPSRKPTHLPSRAPSRSPSRAPSHAPSRSPSRSPSRAPSHSPSRTPTRTPSRKPTHLPSRAPSRSPSRTPSRKPTHLPSRAPSHSPSRAPSRSPSRSPSRAPSRTPTRTPSRSPSRSPSHTPTHSPSKTPSQAPKHPSRSPSRAPRKPSHSPSHAPSHSPSHAPSSSPSAAPTRTLIALPTTTTSVSLQYQTSQANHIDVDNTVPLNVSIHVVQCDGSHPAATWLVVDTTQQYPSSSPQGVISVPYTIDTSLITQVNTAFQQASQMQGCLQLTAMNERNYIFVLPIMFVVNVQVYLQCPPGTKSSTGNNDVDACVSCPRGGYESATYSRVTAAARQTCDNRPCLETYWCGPGAVEPTSYYKYFDFQSIDASVFLGGTRDTTLQVNHVSSSPGSGQTIVFSQSTHSVPSWFSLRPSPSTPIVLADGGLVPVQLSSFGFPDDVPEFSGTVTLSWTASSSPDQSFDITLPVTMNLFTVIVSPASFSYVLAKGSMYSLNDSIGIWNILCNGTLSFTAAPCQESTMTKQDWLVYDKERYAIPTIVDSLTDRGLPVNVPFAINLTGPTNNLQLTSEEIAGFPLQPAVTHDACLLFELDLPSISTKVTRKVTISVKAFESCPRGYYSAGLGSNTNGCNACERGSYTNATGSETCIPCPPDRPITLNDGADGIDVCVTDRGFVLIDGKSKPCLVGAVCTAQGLDLRTLPVMPGYWRSSAESTDIRKCRMHQYCKGGAIVQEANNTVTTVSSASNSTTIGRRRRRALLSLDTNYFIAASQNASVLCASYHTGPLCESCVNDSYVKRGELRMCTYCTEDMVFQDKSRVAGLLFVICFLLCVFAMLWVGSTVYLADKNITAGNGENSVRHTALAAKRFFTRVDIAMKLKSLIGLFQVLGSMSIQFVVVLPAFFSGLANFYNLLKLDIWQFLDVGCAFPAAANSFYSSLLVATLAPLAFLCFVILLYLFVDRRILAKRNDPVLRDEIRSVSVTLCLLTVYLVYPSVSATVLSVWSCDTLDDGTMPLRADYSLDCQTEVHAAYSAYAVLMFLVYVIGVPALTFYFLWKNRARIHPPGPEALVLLVRESDPKIGHLRFLWLQYHPTRWYFEVIDMLRRFMLVSLYVFVNAGSENQMLLEIILSLLFLLILNSLSPYVSYSNAVLATASSYVILLVSLISLILKLEGGSSVIDWYSILVSLVFLVPVFVVLQIIQEFFSENANRYLCPCINWDKMEERMARIKKYMGLSWLFGGGGGGGGNKMSTITKSPSGAIELVDDLDFLYEGNDINEIKLRVEVLKSEFHKRLTETKDLVRTMVMDRDEGRSGIVSSSVVVGGHDGL